MIWYIEILIQSRNSIENASSSTEAILMKLDILKKSLGIDQIEEIEILLQELNGFQEEIWSRLEKEAEERRVARISGRKEAEEKGQDEILKKLQEEENEEKPINRGIDFTMLENHFLELLHDFVTNKDSRKKYLGLSFFLTKKRQRKRRQPR